jgi:phosphatidylglycerol:prolipoprotein diacylglycerol transferase
MSIMGAIVGGIIGIVIYMLIKKRSFLELADIVTSVLLLGQAIGRWGNFFNSELYGKEVTSPALQFFPYAVLVGNQWYEALFFYESVLNLIGFILISVLYFKANTKGLTSGAYLVYYGVVRVILETRRQPQFVLKLWGIKVSLLLSVVMIVAGVVLLAVVISKSVIAKRKNKALGANS